MLNVGRGMADYLLDTHAALWLLEGNPKLSQTARDAIRDAASLALAGISLLEIAMLARRGSIALAPDTASGVRAIAAKFQVLPITAEIASDAVAVALPHKDPFDRVITATTRAHGLTLISKDSKIREAGVVATLW